MIFCEEGFLPARRFRGGGLLSACRLAGGLCQTGLKNKDIIVQANKISQLCAQFSESAYSACQRSESPLPAPESGSLAQPFPFASRDFHHEGFGFLGLRDERTTQV